MLHRLCPSPFSPSACIAATIPSLVNPLQFSGQRFDLEIVPTVAVLRVAMFRFKVSRAAFVDVDAQPPNKLTGANRERRFRLFENVFFVHRFSFAVAQFGSLGGLWQHSITITFRTRSCINIFAASTARRAFWHFWPVIVFIAIIMFTFFLFFRHLAVFTAALGGGALGLFVLGERLAS